MAYFPRGTYWRFINFVGIYVSLTICQSFYVRCFVFVIIICIRPGYKYLFHCNFNLTESRIAPESCHHDTCCHFAPLDSALLATIAQVTYNTYITMSLNRSWSMSAHGVSVHYSPALGLSYPNGRPHNSITAWRVSSNIHALASENRVVRTSKRKIHFFRDTEHMNLT